MTDSVSYPSVQASGPRQVFTGDDHSRPSHLDEGLKMHRESSEVQMERVSSNATEEIRSKKRGEDFEQILNQRISGQKENEPVAETKGDKTKKPLEKTNITGQNAENGEVVSAAIKDSVTPLRLFHVTIMQEKDSESTPKPSSQTTTNKFVPLADKTDKTVSRAEGEVFGRLASLKTTGTKGDPESLSQSKEKVLAGNKILSDRESRFAGQKADGKEAASSGRKNVDSVLNSAANETGNRTERTGTENGEKTNGSILPFSDVIRMAKGKTGDDLRTVQKAPTHPVRSGSSDIPKPDVSAADTLETAKHAVSESSLKTKTLESKSEIHKSLAELNAQVEKSTSEHPTAAEVAGDTSARVRPDATDSLRVEAPAGPDKPVTVQSRLFSESRPHEQILDRIQADFRGPDKEVRLTLNPADLGRVRIHFTQNEQGITGRLEVEKSATRQEIQRHVSEIVAGLQNNGVQVRRIDVAQDHQSPNQEQRPFSQEHFEEFKQYSSEDESQSDRHSSQAHEETKNSTSSMSNVPENWQIQDDRVNIYI
ncbi:MAG: flagellar hook-length control protein FliK [Sedimentisphaerales bacterium]|nr:flagellar hook-length control protein FliK [Sedimentisphaerales bacterium]